MMLLNVENGDLKPAVKEKLRGGIRNQLARTWQGKRVDQSFRSITA